MSARPSSPPNLAFDRATAEDADTFVALERMAASRTYGPPCSIVDALREIADNTLYLIRHRDVVVGSIAYRFRSDGSLYISCLTVDPAHRRRGIARAALGYVLQEAKAAHRVDLVTHPDNAIALRLYESLGFKIESRQENYFGDGEPRLVLAKE